jgi:hypothetical protein
MLEPTLPCWPEPTAIGPERQRAPASGRTLRNVKRGTLALGTAAVVLEIGCLMVWVLSPRLTSIYNAEFSAAYFARAPALLVLTERTLAMMGPLGEPAVDPIGMVARLMVGLALMTVGYAGGLVAVSVCNRPATWPVLSGAFLFRVTLWLLPGLFSTDIFSYVMYGRIAAVYSANPYVQPPADFASDPFLGWVFPFWRDQPSVYGAAWTDVSWLLSALSGGLDNFGQVAAYRGALVVCDVVTLAALWWLLGRLQPAERLAGFLLFAWNPVILFDISANAHNDGPMLALLLLGFAPLVSTAEPSRRRWLVAIGTSVVGSLVKYASGMTALMMTIAFAARAARWPGRLRRLGAVAVVGLALALAWWWPWLREPGALAAIGDAAGGRLVLNSAPDVVATFVAERWHLAPVEARVWLRGIARAAFGLYLVWEGWRLWSRARCGGRAALLATIRASTRAMLLLPLVVLTWVWSWYFSWSLVLAALLGWRSGLTRLVVAYTLVVFPIVYAHQYLGDQLPSVFILVMAAGPPAVLCAGGALRGVFGARRWAVELRA